MEGIATIAYQAIRGCWKRKGYQRLNGPSRRQRKSRVKLARTDFSGSNQQRRRRFWRWRIKLSPKIRFGSPRKWLTKLRDAYVKEMLSFANSSAPSGGRGFGAVDYGTTAFCEPVVKEYDEKMIIEIYKSLVMGQGQIVPYEARKISSPIVDSM